MGDDMNITDQIIEKPKNGWEGKWNQQTYTIYRRPDLPEEPIVNKSTEPWYRRFENKKRKHKK